MRTIKFRGKTLKTGTWVYGCLDDTMPCGYSCILFESSCYRVDSVSVGQFTGLLDKNGVEIYERDIVNFHNTLCIVFFDTDGVYKAKSIQNNDIAYPLYEDAQREIISNTYDYSGLVE